MAEGETTTTTGAGDGKGIAGAKRARGVPYTVSIAVCSSMVDNAQSMELATMLAGQVARCAGIFCADEIVVVDDYGQRGGGNEISSCAAFLARVLQYMETPQYLRRTLIKSRNRKVLKTLAANRKTLQGIKIALATKLQVHGQQS